MKKLLLSAAFLSATFIGANAQTFINDSFETYTAGDLGTDVTGETAGQGGWYTWVSASEGTNSDFQIVDEGGANGNTLQITGSASAESRLIFKDITANWSSRETSNNVLKTTVDFYTGGATSSANQYRVLMYGIDSNNPEADPVILGGINFVASSKVLQGVCYLNNNGTLGTYAITLAEGGLTLSADTWVSIEIIFNQTTGRVSWLGAEGLVDGYFDGASTGFDALEVDMVVVAGTGNAASSVFKMDNFAVGAVASEEDSLSTNNVVLENLFSVYPNPATDIINISNSADAIDNVTITDLNGRTVKQVTLGANEAQINISDLAQGIYILNATSNGKSFTQKIVKQ